MDAAMLLNQWMPEVNRKAGKPGRKNTPQREAGHTRHTTRYDGGKPRA